MKKLKRIPDWKAEKVFGEIRDQLHVPTGEIGFAAVAAVMVIFVILFMAPLVF
jgi:hypothetical protein